MMKYRLVAAVALLPLLVACGGGGSDSDDGTTGGNTAGDTGGNTAGDTAGNTAGDTAGNTGGNAGETSGGSADNGESTVEPDRSLPPEDRTRPASGDFSSVMGPIKDNGANPFSNEGPQEVHPDRIVAWPGLRFGDFLLSNNPWNASAATYDSWYQDITLSPNGDSVLATVDWDWGASADTRGSLFNTKAYPEVIYGVKSLGETSGSFATTGLPVEHYDSPVWTIDYGYSVEGRKSESNSGGGTDSEYNIAIESFYHDSCDIKRDGKETDNQVMEVMVWLKVGDNKPSGQSPHADAFTTSDGRVFDVYAKSSNFNYIAYVAREEQTSGTIMYSEVLNDAFDNASKYGIYQVKDTDCLANILIGTEIWHGAGVFTLEDYQIHRSY